MTGPYIPSPFANRLGMIATMHHKERVMLPLLEAELGIRGQVPSHFDTDQFGTFTRDIARPGSQLATARQKAQRVMEITGATLAFASEGAFGPHPAQPYLPCDRELVLLLDQEQELELVGEALSLDTNYAQQTITSLAEAQQFAAKVGFPDHGLVVKAQAEGSDASAMVKGIISPDHLQEVVTRLLAERGSAWIETDMRALYNPTRMQVIAQATANLVTKARSLCPTCGTPGYTIVETQRGLPCSWCGAPTALPLALIYGCSKCPQREKRPVPGSLKAADPGHCLYCNP